MLHPCRLAVDTRNMHRLQASKHQSHADHMGVHRIRMRIGHNCRLSGCAVKGITGYALGFRCCKGVAMSTSVSVPICCQRVWTVLPGLINLFENSDTQHLGDTALKPSIQADVMQTIA